MKPSLSIQFHRLQPKDLQLIHHWLNQAHVSEWWETSSSYTVVEEEFLPLTDPNATTCGYLAWFNAEPIGFIQSYMVKDSGGGWWEEETDPGARGIDQFLGNAQQLNQGLGTAMVQAFTELLFTDPTVTKIQTDPSPNNARAIRCYSKAGFVAVRPVMTPDGLSLLMLKQRPQTD